MPLIRIGHEAFDQNEIPLTIQKGLVGIEFMAAHLGKNPHLLFKIVPPQVNMSYPPERIAEFAGGYYTDLALLLQALEKDPSRHETFSWFYDTFRLPCSIAFRAIHCEVVENSD